MVSTTIRITKEMQGTLRSMAAKEGKPMREILANAIEMYRRKRMIEMGNQAYAAIRRDPKAWEHELAERRAWESTLGDGLDRNS